MDSEKIEKGRQRRGNKEPRRNREFDTELGKDRGMERQRQGNTE